MKIILRGPMAGKITKLIKRNGLRKCKGEYWNKGNFHEFELGYFHGWGSNYEEFENGAGNYSVAVVELPDGKVIMPVAGDITFLDSIVESGLF